MIIYGYRSSHLRTEPIAGSCPACATPDSLHASVFGRYAHIYWIPLFPIGKTGGSQCGHCQFVQQPKEMEPGLREAFSAVKHSARVPWWHFAGLLLLVIGIGWALVQNSDAQQASQQFITAPHKGDLYHVRTENGRYSLLKVQEAAGNSVKLLPNTYEMDQNSGLDELNKPENFDTVALELTRYELKLMLDKDQIVKVERPDAAK
ncbi:hypothetical protein K3G63_00280 [Hymenobacter sp. HSC-4F20]|uniref:hypothetical protein n=1 Tax=Hymenobacter sp. HSC-4F20 TaxID=2864135 RepID=UPI001C7314AA|nr:hypothetical protein [Hymenobacter sp. HSC-4F20]MBX0288849.1 hypothetical protein [Hymenobacter sp. HSC-4F20]